MIYRLILLLFIGVSVTANYPYQNFDTSSLTIKKGSYNRYIRPQLINIKSEFYLLAKKVYPEHGNISKLRDTALALKISYEKSYKICLSQKKEQSYCDINVVEILKNSYELEKRLETTRKNAIMFKSQKLSEISSNISLLRHLDKIELLNIELQSTLELRNIVNDTLYATYAPAYTKLSNLMNNLFLTINFAFIDHLPLELQDIFENLLIHFITPLEQKMIYDFNPEWFKSQLGALNLTWNTFHMDLEKGSNSVPIAQIKLIKLMHNRWNSILKIIF